MHPGLGSAIVAFGVGSTGCGLYNYSSIAGELDQEDSGVQDADGSISTVSCTPEFTDEFTDGVLGNNWSGWFMDPGGTQIAETAGALTITTTTGDMGNVYAGYLLDNFFPVGYAGVEVVMPPNPATNSQLILNAAFDVDAVITLNGPDIVFRRNDDQSSDVVLTYDPVTMRFMELLWTSDGTTRFLTSSDRVTWRNRRTEVMPGSLAVVTLMGGVWSDNPEDSTASFDNFSTGSCAE